MCETTKNYTPEQEAAINYRGSSLLVSSAAGSGKTMVLVERLLKYIEDNHNIDEFLVITYTRAAAAELRERIYQNLQSKLAGNPNNAHLRRQTMLCRGANIDTIHTFCANVLRENAHLAQLPPDFRVADEDECSLIKDEALDNVFDRTYNKINEDFGISDLLEMYVDSRDDKKLTRIITDIHSRLMSIPDPEGWIAGQIKKSESSEITDVSQTETGSYLMNLLRSRVEHCIRVLLEITGEMESQPELKNNYGDNINAVITGSQRLYEALGENWDKSVEHAEITAPKVKNIKGYDELKEIRKLCLDELKKISKYLDTSSCDHINDMKRLIPAVKSIYNLVLEFDKAYSEEKRKRGIIDFSDIEHLTLSLLYDKSSHTKTEIAKSLSGRFTEILVDEYQDVNEVQEMLFKSLSKDENNIFMVGDVKQSIYRFRLAEPAIFLRKYKDYEEYRFEIKQEKTSKKPKKIFLSKNFRSQPGILEAINHIFRKIMSEELGEIEYSDDEALIPGRIQNEELQGKQGNPYCVEPSDSVSAERQSTPGYEPAVEYDLISMDTADDSEDEDITSTQLEARYVAVRIKKLLDSGYEIEDKDGQKRKITPSDIAILSRTIKGKTWRYASELTKLGIKSDISGSEDYFNTIEIQTIISFLSIIDNPNQDIPFAAVLNGLIYGLTSDEISQIRTNNSNDSFYNAIIKSAEHDNKAAEITDKCRNILSEIDTLREMAYDMPSDRFIWSVYNRIGILKKVSAMKNGTQRRNNLITFVEFAQNYEKSGYKGLFSFLRFIQGLQERGADITKGQDSFHASSGQKDTVKILSIHKSKGLEFPVVFLVDTSKQHNMMDLRKPVVFHKDFGIGGQITDTEKRIRYTTLARTAISEKLKSELLSEELRILYVAMTRAREKLILVATFKDCGKKYNDVKALAGISKTYSPQALMTLGSIAQWLMAGTMDIDNKLLKINMINEPVSESEAEDSITADYKDNGEKEQNDNRLRDLDRAVEKFVYPHQLSVELPSKLTVTAIKSITDKKTGAVDALSDNASWVDNEDDKVKEIAKKPQFLAKEIQLTGAEKGTLIHEIMRYIDYNSCSSDTDIRNNIEKLIISRLVGDEANRLDEKDINRILCLFKSELGTRLRQAVKVTREFRYSLLSLSKNYFENSGNDKILIQGIIDCFFEEGGEIVIVDFKTDKVNKSNIEQRIQKYAPQLNEYSEALERITKKKVKERILYFFETGAAYKLHRA